MATNKKPPGTVTVPIHLPDELHYKVVRIAARGKVSELIVDCASNEIEERWKQWLKEEMTKAKKSSAKS